MVGSLKNILVVEDDESLRWMLEQFFESFPDTQVKSCGDVDKAMHVLDQGFHPHIAVCDYHLGATETSTGICFRLNEDYPDCVIFLTSGVVDENVASAKGQIKVHGFLEKPFSFEDLDSRMNKIIEGTEARTFGLTRFPEASEEQISQLREVAGQRPGDDSVKRLLAFSLYIACRYPEAYAIYEELLTKGTDFYAAYYGGHTCIRMNKYGRAIEFWQRALELTKAQPIIEKLQRRIECAKQMV